MERAHVGAAVGEHVHEERSLAEATFVADSESRKCGLAAAVVVVQIDEERDDTLAALRAAARMSALVRSHNQRGGCTFAVPLLLALLPLEVVLHSAQVLHRLLRLLSLLLG